jgi:hypothetical protein
MKINTVILIAVLSLAVGFGGGYFFKNYQVGKMRPNFGNLIQNQPGNQILDRQRNGQGPQTGFGGMVVGEVISQDEKSITVKVQDGGTKIVILGDSTTYTESQTVEKSEIGVGNQVRVLGSANSDGSVTARNVQINP